MRIVVKDLEIGAYLSLSPNPHPREPASYGLRNPLSYGRLLCVTATTLYSTVSTQYRFTVY